MIQTTLFDSIRIGEAVFDRPRKTNPESQDDRILQFLQAGNTLTPLEALDRFGCFRLGARIWELKRQGWLIESEIVEADGGKRVARYKMGG